jgi:hypothetical protein
VVRQSSRLSFRSNRLNLELLEAFLGFVPILRVADVGPPAVERDRVDRPATLDQQVDCVADLALTVIRGLDEVTGVEDHWQKVVEVGHHEVRRWIVRLFDDVRDLTIEVRVTDTIPEGLLPRHFFDEEGGVGALFLLTADDILEIRLENVVAQDQHEVVVDVLFDGQQRVGESFLLTLVSVRDRDTAILAAVVVDDLLFEVADGELVSAEVDELIETMSENRFIIDFHHAS